METLLTYLHHFFDPRQTHSTDIPRISLVRIDELVIHYPFHFLAEKDTGRVDSDSLVAGKGLNIIISMSP